MHGALDQFQLLDLRLDWSITVGQRESSHHRIFVFQDARDELQQFGNLADLDGLYPGIEARSLSLVDHRQEVPNQRVGCFRLSTGRSDEGQLLLLPGRQGVGITNEEPDGMVG